MFRKPYLRRDVLKRATQIYKEMYATPEGHLPATLQILSYIGWKNASNRRAADPFKS
jgi:hypothetical protein